MGQTLGAQQCVRYIIRTISSKPGSNSMLEALAFTFIDGNQLREVKVTQLARTGWRCSLGLSSTTLS